MTVSLLGMAAPGFDRLLDVLEACHGRIARQCGRLQAHRVLQADDLWSLGRAMAARRALRLASPEPGRRARDERD